MTADIDLDRAALEAALAGRGEHELFACDPALADTAAFCAAYGFAMEDSANTIIVVGKGAEPVYAACVVLATHRLDVNRVVKTRFGRKASFASTALPSRRLASRNAALRRLPSSVSAGS